MLFENIHTWILSSPLVLASCIISSSLSTGLPFLLPILSTRRWVIIFKTVLTITGGLWFHTRRIKGQIMLVHWVTVYSMVSLVVTFSGVSNISPSNNWHERKAFQRSAFKRSTADNDVVATIFIRLLFFPVFFSPRFFSSVATFSHRRSARIKKLI